MQGKGEYLPDWLRLMERLPGLIVLDHPGRIAGNDVNHLPSCALLRLLYRGSC